MKLTKLFRPCLAIASLGLSIFLAGSAHAQQQIQQSTTSRKIPFLLVQSSDHISPLTGATVTVTLSKNGASFAAPAGTVSEVGNGWYVLTPATADTGTLGPLLLHATAANADPVDKEFNIIAINQDDAVGLGLSRLDAAVSTRSTYSGADTAGITTLLTRVPQPLLFSGGGFVKAFSILDLTQPLDETLVGATTGGAMNGARSAIGKVTITGTPGQANSFMNFYKADGTTILKSLSLSISGSRQ